MGALRRSLVPYLDEGGPEYRLVPFSRLREEIIRQVEAEADEAVGITKRLWELRAPIREALGVVRAPEVDPSSSLVAAVDAGVNGKDTALGFYPVVAAVGVVFRGGRRAGEPLAATFKMPRTYLEEEEAVKQGALMGFYLQFELARLLLAEGMDLVMLDGSLLLRRSRYSPRARRYGSSYLDLFEHANSSLVRLLEEARSSGVPVVGVVKRVRSSMAVRALGLSGLSDLALFQAVLDRGEYAGPFEMGRDADELVGWAVRLGLDPDGLAPRAFFLRVGRRTLRVEVPEYCLGEARWIMGLVLSLSRGDLPIPLAAADSLARVTNRDASLAYRRLVARVVRSLGPAGADALSLLTLQHGEV